jgi:primosomal protein N' (replication factor Y)
MLFADIAFPIAVREVFTYTVPDHLSKTVLPGRRVFVPFGNSFKIGMTMRVHSEKPAFEAKPVEDVIDDAPVMDETLLELAAWMARYYYCGPGECVHAMMPVGMQVDSVMWLRPSKAALEQKGGKWDAVHAIFARESLVKRSHLITGAGVSESWINARIKNGELLREFIPETRMKAPVYERLTATPFFTEEALLTAAKNPKKPAKWIRQAQDLRDADLLPAPAAELRAAGFDGETLRRLLELDFLRVQSYEPVFSLLPGAETRLNPLNPEQQTVFEEINQALNAKHFASFLLKGITGSGKTEVYLHALAKTLAAGRNGLILVPEIALTPQTVRRFRNVFGEGIAVLHSRLSDRERLDEWEHIRNGRKRIVIGARSAVFAPLADIGLIVIDEEHDSSFKQADPAPRYHAREVALVRARACGAVVLSGSATPALASLESVQAGKARLLTLSARHGRAALPPVHIVDLKKYRQAGMHGPLAAPLFLACEEALGIGNQVILLHNRRGYANYVQCLACGNIPECPHCSVFLTFHKHSGQLRCHYCGYSQTSAILCRTCGAADFFNQGKGTQQIEEELTTLFPGVSIARFDLDTLSGKHAHEEILAKFSRGESQLLIGTQLVTKGLDFPDVTVVGVVNADTELAFPSYRSNERWFQMLAQVAGRAGRAHKPGNVFIQTRRADEMVIRFAAKHDYDGFAELEREQRQALWYPPFARLIRIELKDKNAQKPMRAGERLAAIATNAFPGIPVLGPSPSSLLRRSDYFYWEMLIKLPNTSGASHIEKYLNTLFDKYRTDLPEGLSSVSIIPVVDPMN